MLRWYTLIRYILHRVEAFCGNIPIFHTDRHEQGIPDNSNCMMEIFIHAKLHFACIYRMAYGSEISYEYCLAKL